MYHRIVLSSAPSEADKRGTTRLTPSSTTLPQEALWKPPEQSATATWTACSTTSGLDREHKEARVAQARRAATKQASDHNGEIMTEKPFAGRYDRKQRPSSGPYYVRRSASHEKRWRTPPLDHPEMRNLRGKAKAAKWKDPKFVAEVRKPMARAWLLECNMRDFDVKLNTILPPPPLATPFVLDLSDLEFDNIQLGSKGSLYADDPRWNANGISVEINYRAIIEHEQMQTKGIPLVESSSANETRFLYVTMVNRRLTIVEVPDGSILKRIEFDPHHPNEAILVFADG